MACLPVLNWSLIFQSGGGIWCYHFAGIFATADSFLLKSLNFLQKWIDWVCYYMLHILVYIKKKENKVENENVKIERFEACEAS